VQWSGSPPPDPTNWDTITYTYDPAGRRIKKNVVGSYIVKYVYDGDHVIAEYDDSGLLRKYIYGARVDEPVCMIDVADNNKAYYYHFDGLGSVVALSNSNGDSCQSYEYSAYGQVAASDPNHPNPYMFTGRRFDIETGLYYYRARYYNPHIGRFMQTDTVGYGAGMNWYAYCGNNPLGRVDPSGNYSMSVRIPTECITDNPDATTAYRDVTDWLYDVGFGDDYQRWYIEYIDIDGSDFDISLTDGSDITDACDVKVPEFRIEHVGSAQVVVIDDIGRLDSRDRTLKMIMDAWFAEKMAMDRWSWSIADWYDNVRNCAVTPFRGQGGSDLIKKWYSGGKIYDNTEINYVGFGFGAAHFRSPLHLIGDFRIMNRYWPQIWNRWNYQHWAGPDQFWFNKGWDLYPG